MSRHRLRERSRSEAVKAAVVGVVVAGLVAAAGIYGYNKYSAEEQQVQAARQLASQEVELSPATPSGSPRETPIAESSSTTPATPKQESPRAVPAPTPVDVQPVLPVARFHWPAAQLSVEAVPMEWRADQTINPPLDANGFDPVAHWLKGSGEAGPAKSIILAAHTCTSPDRRVCNETTFPFIKLSFEGWAVGQPASLVDSAGQTINYTLVDRQVVDKAKAFEPANERCFLVVFSCNAVDPEGEITLVTFRRDGCGT